MKNKMNAIVTKFSVVASKTAFQLKQHSPEICMGVGALCIVGGTIAACVATRKVDDILEETKERIDTIHEHEEKLKEKKEEYTAKGKDVALVYTSTGLKLVKLYAPSVTVLALGITSVFVANGILKKRNVALAAAYTAVDTSFKEYRNRVIEKFGKDVDNELRYNTEKRTVKEVVIDENGKEAEIEKTEIIIGNMDDLSPYHRRFDKTCTGYSANPTYASSFLRAQQAFANEMLRARGHLFLNEVYDMFGMDRSTAGAVVGWRYTPDENRKDADNCVEFDIFETQIMNAHGVLENVILIDFNPDGVIYKDI